MTAQYKIYPHHRITVFEFSGDYTADECVVNLGRYLQDPLCNPDFDLLLDMVNAESTDSTFAQMEKLTNKITSSIPESNRSICILIATTDLLFGAARMYQMMIEDKVSYPIEIVRNRTAALSLLGFKGDDYDVLDRPPSANGCA